MERAQRPKPRIGYFGSGLAAYWPQFPRLKPAVLDTMERLNKSLSTTFIFATHDEKVIRYLRRKITLIDGKVARDEAMTPQKPGGADQ